LKELSSKIKPAQELPHKIESKENEKKITTKIVPLGKCKVCGKSHGWDLEAEAHKEFLTGLVEDAGVIHKECVKKTTSSPK